MEDFEISFLLSNKRAEITSESLRKVLDKISKTSTEATLEEILDTIAKELEI